MVDQEDFASMVEKIALIAVGLLTLGLLGACASSSTSDSSTTTGEGGPNVDQTDPAREEDEKALANQEATKAKDPPCPQLEFDLFDPTDDRRLIGFATDVFFGRVVERVEAEPPPAVGPGPDIPEARFAVEVGEPIKGEPMAAVVVNQKIGIREEDDASNSFECGPLLEPGREYLFVTRYVEVEGLYDIVGQSYGAIEIDDEKEREEVKQRYERAVAEEIPSSPEAVVPSEQKGPGDRSPSAGNPPEASAGP